MSRSYIFCRFWPGFRRPDTSDAAPVTTDPTMPEELRGLLTFEVDLFPFEKFSHFTRPNYNRILREMGEIVRGALTAKPWATASWKAALLQDATSEQKLNTSRLLDRILASPRFPDPHVDGPVLDEPVHYPREEEVFGEALWALRWADLRHQPSSMPAIPSESRRRRCKVVYFHNPMHEYAIASADREDDAADVIVKLNGRWGYTHVRPIFWSAPASSLSLADQAEVDIELQRLHREEMEAVHFLEGVPSTGMGVWPLLVQYSQGANDLLEAMNSIRSAAPPQPQSSVLSEGAAEEVTGEDEISPPSWLETEGITVGDAIQQMMGDPDRPSFWKLVEASGVPYWRPGKGKHAKVHGGKWKTAVNAYNLDRKREVPPAPAISRVAEQTFRCIQCRHEFSSARPQPDCPKCGGVATKLKQKFA